MRKSEAGQASLAADWETHFEVPNGVPRLTRFRSANISPSIWASFTKEFQFMFPCHRHGLVFAPLRNPFRGPPRVSEKKRCPAWSIPIVQRNVLLEIRNQIINPPRLE